MQTGGQREGKCIVSSGVNTGRALIKGILQFNWLKMGKACST